MFGCSQIEDEGSQTFILFVNVNTQNAKYARAKATICDCEYFFKQLKSYEVENNLRECHSS